MIPIGLASLNFQIKKKSPEEVVDMYAKQHPRRIQLL